MPGSLLRGDRYMGFWDFFRKKEVPKEDSYLIAGLGNPGERYEKTRHNAGFMVTDLLVERHGIRQKAMYGQGEIEGRNVYVIKPLTFMNNSGDAIRPFMDYFKIERERLIVIYDDINLSPGAIRIRKKGSAGGHNGMKSIIARVGTEDFPRVRVGVGQKPKEWDLIDHVLSAPTGDDAKYMAQGIEKANDAISVILKDGIEEAMNRFNRKN